MDILVVLDPSGLAFTEAGMLVQFKAYTIVAGGQHVVPVEVEYVFGQTANAKRQAFVQAARDAFAAYAAANAITFPAVRNVEVWGV
jgi:hypothetical protein